MITGFYKGGLGNQLFQIAVGVSLALDNNDEYGLNPYLDKGRGQGHSINAYLDNIFSNITRTTKECHNHYIEDPANPIAYQPIPYQPNLNIIGYFQSEKHFLNKKEVMNALFGFTPNKSSGKAVIHVRMGDYLVEGSNFKVVTPEYFDRAIKLVQEYDKNIKFEVVTDDPVKAKEYLPSDLDAVYHIGTGEVEDLHTLSNAEYCIMSNSSFSWWGSYLGKEKITIAPDIWFPPHVDIDWSDVYREDMKRVEV